MADAFESLRRPETPLEPRPGYAIALRRRVELALGLTTGAPMDTYLYYLTLPAPDVERSRRFYGDLFGWEFDEGSEGLHVRSTAQPMGLHAGREHLAAKAYFAVSDVTAAAARVRELGGTVGEVNDDESGASVDCTDDQGTRFALSYPAHPEPPRYGDAHGDLFYFSLPVPDGTRATRFFSSLLGWEFDAEGEQGGLHVANMVTEGGLGAGRPGHDPEVWFRVGDLDAALATIRRNGGDAEEPFASPEGTHVACVDDQGVPFNITVPAEGF